MGKHDCVKLFNDITHDESDNIDKKIFENIMSDFNQYIFIREITEKCTKIKAEVRDSILHFRIEVNSDEVYSDISKMHKTKIKHKKKSYIINVKIIDNNTLEVYFKLK